jgi:radical SAM protein with 4Fe4S-binding SPASM domain
MCGQWSEEGYMHDRDKPYADELTVADWKRLVDEVAAHDITGILLRGGEPFFYPGIVELLEHIHEKGIFTAIDTNGSQLEKYAEDIIRLGNMHLTVSVDGPEAIHDEVRCLQGSYQSLREGIARLQALEREKGVQISQSICFTISPYSIKGLGQMPDVARDLGIQKICVNPYYWFPKEIGRQYEKELREDLNCKAFSWCGFHHDDSGVDIIEFEAQYKAYKENLKDLIDVPYMPFTPEQYRTWFTDPVKTVGASPCMNVERLIDIQPGGDANFCVDFPDYTFGNVRDASLETLWNSEEAKRFRDYRRKSPLSICHRCGSKYMSVFEE